MNVDAFHLVPEGKSKNTVKDKAKMWKKRTEANQLDKMRKQCEE